MIRSILRLVCFVRARCPTVGVRSPLRWPRLGPIPSTAYRMRGPHCERDWREGAGMPGTARGDGVARGYGLLNENDVDALAGALLAASYTLRQSESPDDVALGEAYVSAAAALWARAARRAGGAT